jgi:quercetin dioxygenase-like cupin family protein
LHHHPVISAGVLLEGELTVVGSEGSTLQLLAGDAIIEMVDTPHYGMNQGSEDASSSSLMRVWKEDRSP